MDESLVDEPDQRLASSRMDDRRSPRHQYLTPRLAGSMALAQLLHPSRHIRDDVSMRPLGRYLCLHKAEYIALLGPPQRGHTDSRTSDDHGITLVDGSHRHRASSRLLRVHNDA